MQDPLPFSDNDVLVRPIHYHKDKRSGEDYIKLEEEKKKMETKTSKPRVKPTAASTAASTSESFITIDQGSVRIPTPPVQPAAAVQALQDIVFTLQTFTDTVQGLIANLQGGEEQEEPGNKN
ncbi:unnamed protein product [Microthlaspi erraticum]|uniref:Uncharacterized protein n=1 Tax=Microthlaspi erraticum TaxID=1685480 RepID=A0A6D2I934_9BRAS|nr:unnamed protein product [Microthlaspi erraticum]